MTKKTNQEMIEEMNKGKNPEFLKKIENLFRRPVIVIQTKPVESTEGKEKSEEKPKDKKQP